MKNWLNRQYADLKTRHTIVLLFFQYLIVFTISGLFNDVISNLDFSQATYDPLKNVVLLLFSPIKEELKYRWFIGIQNSRYFLTSISIFISDIFLSFIYVSKFQQTPYIYLILYFALLILSSLIIFKSAKWMLGTRSTQIISWSKRNNVSLIFVSALLFGLWHGVTYNLSYGWNFMYVFGISTIGALFFSLVRIKFGLGVAIVYHFIYNAPIFLAYHLLWQELN